MNQVATSEHSAPPILGSASDVEAALFAHRNDFVIDLREAGRTRSYLRGHESSPASFSRHSLRGFVGRAADVVLAAAALLVTSPVFVIVAVSSRLGSPGPAFFVQERVGQHGRIFRCLKFRSMHTDATERLTELLHTDERFRATWAADQKVVQDPRVTKVGRVLRKTSLDELPQLINVIKGDMSLVGPRPIVPEETIRYGEAMPIVLTVRPGITGLWQVSGRNNLPYPERVALDVRYVEEQSLAMDSWVLAKTLVCVVTGRGAV